MHGDLNVKEVQKRGTFVYEWLIPSAVLILSQHCKATMLQ